MKPDNFGIELDSIEVNKKANEIIYRDDWFWHNFGYKKYQKELQIKKLLLTLQI